MNIMTYKVDKNKYLSKPFIIVLGILIGLFTYIVFGCLLLQFAGGKANLNRWPVDVVLLLLYGIPGIFIVPTYLCLLFVICGLYIRNKFTDN